MRLLFQPSILKITRSGMALACVHWWLFVDHIPARLAESGVMPFRLNVSIVSSSDRALSSSSSLSTSPSTKHHADTIRTSCSSFFTILQVSFAQPSTCISCASAATALSSQPSCIRLTLPCSTSARLQSTADAARRVQAPALSPFALLLHPSPPTSPASISIHSADPRDMQQWRVCASSAREKKSVTFCIRYARACAMVFLIEKEGADHQSAPNAQQ